MNRRTFLRTTGLGAAGLLLAGAGSESPLNQNGEVLKINSQLLGEAVSALLAQGLNADQMHFLSREGLGYTDFRYSVESGNSAMAVLIAGKNGVVKRMRNAGDDVITGIYHVRGEKWQDLTNAFDIYVPQGANASYYKNWSPLAHAPAFDFDTMMGATREEQLTQWVATDLNLQMQTGDYLVMTQLDDPQKQVNVGLFSTWDWQNK